MKKTMMIAAAIGLALLIGAPASALETEFSGELKMQGISHDNVNLETDSNSASYYRSRFRLKTTFGINDNVSVTTQFDALDKYWGKEDDVNIDGSLVEPDDNIDWDTAYATIKTDFGGFLVGRQWNSQWGLGIGDSTDPVDRILYVLPIDNFTFAAYAQKYNENDEVSDYADADNDKYVALLKYQGDNFELGYLQAFYNFKQFPAMRDMIDYRSRIHKLSYAEADAIMGQIAYDATRAAYAQTLNVSQAELDQAIYSPSTTTAQTINAGLTGAGLPDMPTLYNAYYETQTAYTTALLNAASGLTYANSARAYIADPYFIAKFDDFTFKGELLYGWGEADFDTGKNLDVSVLQYLFEAGYATGPFNLRGGYWFMSGDNDTTDSKHESFAYIEPNKDLDIAFLLTGDNDHYTCDLTDSLGGGIGNFAGNAQNPLAANEYAGALSLAGAKMFYLGFDYKPLDTLTLGLTWANAKADKPPGPRIYAGTEEWDDDVGNELDFKIVWKPWSNLEYKFITAHLDAGDFWKQGVEDRKIDDLTTFYNSLTISF